jgi:hypothetical protein
MFCSKEEFQSPGRLWRIVATAISSMIDYVERCRHNLNRAVNMSFRRGQKLRISRCQIKLFPLRRPFRPAHVARQSCSYPYWALIYPVVIRTQCASPCHLFLATLDWSWMRTWSLWPAQPKVYRGWSAQKWWISHKILQKPGNEGYQARNAAWEKDLDDIRVFVQEHFAMGHKYALDLSTAVLKLIYHGIQPFLCKTDK